MQGVIARLRRIDDELPPSDGAAVFNRMYLTVTEAVAAGLDGDTVFVDPAFMEQLDVTFASLWIEAYDADAHYVPRAWAALFERRHDRAVLPIQFALAGMNSHIEHDLAVAVVQTCRQRDTSPERAGVHHDYEAVNQLLAACESKVRRSFLSAAGQDVDAHLGPVVHSSTRGTSTRPVTSPGSTSRPCGPSVTSARWPTSIEPHLPARSAWRRAVC